jgi:hypothetical protein
MRSGAAALLLVCAVAAAATASPAAAVAATAVRHETGLRGLLIPRHHQQQQMQRPGVGLSTPSGMEVEVSQKLLDYGATILNQLIAIELAKTAIPEISGKKDGFKCAYSWYCNTRGVSLAACVARGPLAIKLCAALLLARCHSPPSEPPP